MNAAILLLALAATGGAGYHTDAAKLPHCSNRVISEVVKRAGCTVGDMRCWTRSGGFCTDWVEKRVAAVKKLPVKDLRLVPVAPEQVARGDLAIFAGRSHTAFVERVVKDRNGRAVAVDLSEYNFGTCWVDPSAMATEKYGVAGRRLGVPLAEVDGGFQRPASAGR